MVPPDNIFGSLSLLEQVEHVLLVGRVEGFDRNQVPALRHGEHVHHLDGVVVDDFPQHQAHDFDGHSGSAMLEHFEEGEWRNLDLLGGVRLALGVEDNVLFEVAQSGK